MRLFNLSFAQVCDPKLDQIVDAVVIDRPPPVGSLSTELAVSERSRASANGCCPAKDVRVLTMSSALLEMYNTSPSLSGNYYVTRQHLAGLVTHMTSIGWVFECRTYIQPQVIWASFAD